MIGEIAAGANAAFKIFDVSYQLYAADAQTAELLNTTIIIEKEIQHAREQRRAKAASLEADVVKFIDEKIQEATEAVRGVASLVDRCRVNKATTQHITLFNRALWLFRDSPNVQERFRRLQVCHTGLTGVISTLHAVDLNAASSTSTLASQVNLLSIQNIVEAQQPLAHGLAGNLITTRYDPQLDELFYRRKLRRQRPSLSESLRGEQPFSSGEPLSYNAVSPPPPLYSDVVQSVPQGGVTAISSSTFEKHSIQRSEQFPLSNSADLYEFPAGHVSIVQILEAPAQGSGYARAGIHVLDNPKEDQRSTVGAHDTHRLLAASFQEDAAIPTRQVMPDVSHQFESSGPCKSLDFSQEPELRLAPARQHFSIHAMDEHNQDLKELVSASFSPIDPSADLIDSSRNFKFSQQANEPHLEPSAISFSVSPPDNNHQSPSTFPRQQQQRPAEFQRHLQMDNERTRIGGSTVSMPNMTAHEAKSSAERGQSSERTRKRTRDLWFDSADL